MSKERFNSIVSALGEPYFSDGAGRVAYLGDSRDLLPLIPADVVITDPVWPDAKADIIGIDRPYELFAEICAAIHPSVKRCAFQFGCDSDPRILRGVPRRYPFFRTSWLEYTTPHYKGRLLYTADIGFLYGSPPKPAPGKFVIPGKYLDTTKVGKEANHPCPRKFSHVQWLVKWWTEPGEIIVDPYAGALTTLVAAKRAGAYCICIEIDEKHLANNLRRMDQGVLDFAEADA